MKWLRDLISHWFGHETYDEAYERILRSFKELPPAPMSSSRTSACTTRRRRLPRR